MKKVAIIGAGQVAEKYMLLIIKRSDVLELAAVVDPVSQRAEDFADVQDFLMRIHQLHKC